LERRQWLVVGVALGVALVGGSATGLAVARRGDRTSTLQPLAAEPAQPASPTPSRRPAPPTRSPAAPSATPSPIRTRAPAPAPSGTPTPARTPARTPSRTPSPTARTDVAYVRIDNTFPGTVVVGVHGTHGTTFTLQAGQHLDVEVLPEPSGNDGVSAGSADHPTCGMGDAGPYFTVGKHYRLVIFEQQDACQVEGGPFGAPFFRVDPA
jgi:hypothetical protein